MKYSTAFERDFKWMLKMRHAFSFDGTAEYYKGDKNIIQFDKKGTDGKEAFYTWDSTGKIAPTKHPNLLHALLKTKGSINLHIKMYAEDRANCSLPGIEFQQMCKEWEAPEWFVKAVEMQKMKHWPV